MIPALSRLLVHGLVGSLLAASFPAPAAAALAKAATPAGPAFRPATAAAGSLQLRGVIILRPSANAALTFSPSPSTMAPVPASPVTARQRLSAAADAVAADAARLPRADAASARTSADAQFSALLGENAVARADAVLAPAEEPAPAAAPRPLPALGRPSAPAPDPDVARRVKRMMLATAVMKTGMETVTLSIPLLVLQTLGGATMVAGLVVAYGLAQAAFGAGVEGLARRWSARRILAGAVAAQALLVGAVVGLGALGLLTPAVLFPLYLLIGGAVGVIETTRRVIPPLLLGRDAAVLAQYNARLHIFYEVAGVAGALGAGALIALAGPLWSLLLQPPAYLLAAWLFFGVKHAKPAPEPGDAARDGLLAKIKGYLSDVKDGARIVLGDVKLRWIALAFVLPQIVHRVFESLLIPVYAKKVLEEPSFSAYLLTASNLGELVGAVLLLKFAGAVAGPRVWVRWGALGLLLSWGLVFTSSLPFLLPVILLFSMTWASSDLALLSTVQKSVSEKEAPRAISFLYGAFVLGSAAISLLMGRFLDLLPVDQAFIWICAAFSALAAAVWLASRRS